MTTKNISRNILLTLLPGMPEVPFHLRKIDNHFLAYKKYIIEIKSGRVLIEVFKKSTMLTESVIELTLLKSIFCHIYPSKQTMKKKELFLRSSSKKIIFHHFMNILCISRENMLEYLIFHNDILS